MGKSEYKRDWSEYDENVITRYELMFPFYVFQHWWDLLAEENRDAKKTHKAPKGVQRLPSVPPLVLTLQAMEGY
jgi:transposase, IS4 family